MGWTGISIFRRDAKTGTLRQLPGEAGCLVQVSGPAGKTFGCGEARGLGTARGLTLSRDGRFLYLASIVDELAIFRRDAKTGRLAQPKGEAGCISETARTGCAAGRGFYGLHRLSFSPDERFAYVGGKRGQLGGSAIVILRHNAKTGALTQLPGKAGCFTSTPRSDCGTGRMIQGAHDALPSRDGRTLYIPADNTGGGIGIWRIDPKTGHIKQLPGRFGCVDDFQTSGDGCMNGPRTGGIHILAETPNGRFLYGAGEDSRAVTGFRILP